MWFVVVASAAAVRPRVILVASYRSLSSLSKLDWDRSVRHRLPHSKKKNERIDTFSVTAFQARGLPRDLDIHQGGYRVEHFYGTE